VHGAEASAVDAPAYQSEPAGPADLPPVPTGDAVDGPAATEAAQGGIPALESATEPTPESNPDPTPESATESPEVAKATKGAKKKHPRHH